MSITPESVETLLASQDIGDRLKALNQIRQLPIDQGFKLIQIAVEDTNPRIRYAAVSQLSNLGVHNLPQAEVILRKSLRDRETDVQAAAADSIGALKLKEVFEELKLLYETSGEWLVRFSIIAALGDLGDERAFDLLREALNSDNDLIQTAAIGAFGELGDERAIPLLAPFTHNPDWQIRYRTALAAGRFSTPEAHAILQELTQDSVEQIAQTAQMSLNVPQS